MIKIFAVFPGQGSQAVGMGKDLFENFAIVRETFEEASESIKVNLKKLCFEGPESDLTLTENTQPCLLVTSICAFRVAKQELGFTPEAAAGHSLGEYSALVAAGAFPLASATRWVRERGLAMQCAVPSGLGTMAAIIGLDDSLIDGLCNRASTLAHEKRATGVSPELSVEAIVEPANFNSPGQVVIAGSIDAVAEAITLVKTDPRFAGGKALPLSVSAPFHCKLMSPAKDRMAELFSLATAYERPKFLRFPYVPNRTVRLTREADIVFDLLIEQVDQPVLWKQSITGLIESGFTQGVEFGHGKVLTGLTKRIDTAKRVTMISVSDSGSLKALEATQKEVVR